MAKLKTPLLSLGAHGSLSQAVTFQRAHKTNFARRKPTPANPQSLGQLYQRWDYQDQAYSWHDLSIADKLTWETNARRFHMTGFAYWMRTRLNTLPNIVARWRLDETAGAIANDSSKNSNPGTIIGASPIKGRIAGAYHFDGLNDEIEFGNALILSPDTFTLSLFFRPHKLDGWQTLFGNHLPSAPGTRKGYGLRISGSLLRADMADGNGDVVVAYKGGLLLDTWYHAAMVHILNTSLTLYLNGVLGMTAPITGITKSTDNIRLGPYPTGDDWPYADFDDVILANEATPLDTIKRQSERRYSL